jgi:hypothetical protein
MAMLTEQAPRVELCSFHWCDGRFVGHSPDFNAQSLLKMYQNGSDRQRPDHGAADWTATGARSVDG